MSRSDGKLFELLADEQCRDLARILVREGKPLTQRQLGELLKLDSATVSRRMTALEDFGLVERKSSHAAYALLFPAETHALLLNAFALIEAARQRQADQACLHKQELARGAEHDVTELGGS
jgi:DNA-binding MarR family transcriptional regulator